MQCGLDLSLSWHFFAFSPCHVLSAALSHSNWDLLYTYPVLSAVLAVASGAVGGVWGRRNVVGSLPGALLALAWYVSVGYPRGLGNVPWLPWAVLGFLALGYASARLVGLRRRKWIDVPLDGRIGFAVFSGFLLRGLFTLLLNCPEFRRILQWHL